MRHSCTLVLLGALLLLALCVAAGDAQPPPNEQRRLQNAGTLPRENQRLPIIQVPLQQYMRRAALLYLHRLDGLACRDLCSLGDEALFVAAVGNKDGSDRNAIYFDGDRNPRYEPDGPYIFPSNSYQKFWPAAAELNTFWHEINHSLLQAGGVAINPAPYAAALKPPGDTDDHHAFIEGVGERGAEAYVTLYGFEDAVRRADEAESRYAADGRPIDFSAERQLWADAHVHFRTFLQRMQLVANMPAVELNRYQNVTGVFFSTAEQVAEVYRNGVLRRLQRGEMLPIRPPAWVFFPNLLLMPVRIEVRDSKGNDLEQPGALAKAEHEVKDDVYRQEFCIRIVDRGLKARVSERAKVASPALTRGQFRIKLVEDEPLVSLAVARGTGGPLIEGVPGPGGPSTHSFLIDLANNGAPRFQLVFRRRKLSELTRRTTYRVELSYADAGADPVYDSSVAQLAVTLGSGSTAGKSSAAPATPVQPPTTPSTTTRPPPVAPANALGATMSWGPLPAGMRCYPGRFAGTKPPAPLAEKGEVELAQGPVLYFQKGEPSNRRSPYLCIELIAHQSKAAFPSLAEYTARAKAQDPHNDLRLNKHGEITVGGRRGYESLGGADSKIRANHFFYLELDPERGVTADILCEIRPGGAKPEDSAPLQRDLEAVIKSLRFGPDSSGLALQKKADAPLPRQFTNAPITKDELLPRPAPPPPDVPGAPGVDPKRENRYREYSSPAGYALQLPAAWKAGAKTGEAQLFNAPNQLYVLACPNTKLSPPEDFASFREKLAAGWQKQDGTATVQATMCGQFPALLVTQQQAERLIWHVYVGSGRQALDFQVLGAPGAKTFPSELLGIFSRLKGLTTP